MKAFSKFFFLAFVMIFSGKLAAQETIQINDNLSQYYYYELFKWDLSGRIMYGNLTSSVSNIAYNRDMTKRLQSYADTKQYYEIFKKQNSTGKMALVGVSLYLIGASGMALSAIVMDHEYFSIAIENGMAVLAGSAVTFVIGVIVSSIGNLSASSGIDSLYNSLSLYNRHKIEEYNK
ncbi:MAG: hypothetical protein LBC53_04110 [Spirochaetaceae bacterium]|jgi:hypothetical protein|nr:hypothetical protein [Spirochaetaceae bacterium]